MRTRIGHLTLLLVGAIGLSGCDGGDTYICVGGNCTEIEGGSSQVALAHDTAAKADVMTIGKVIATWFVYNAEMPTVTQPGGVGTEYFVDGESVGYASRYVELGFTDGLGVTGTNSTNWCVYVTNDQGDIARTGFSYSADEGLQPVSERPC